MTWADELADDAAKAARHQALARTFWSKLDGKEEDDAEPAPGGHPGDSAVSLEQPAATARLAVVAAARKLRGVGRVAVAGSAAVTPAAPRSGVCGYTADRVDEGPWGPSWWVVRDLATRLELTRYRVHEVDGSGAILRYLQEEQCWMHQQMGEGR
ncbi:MAG: hypothetical protein QM692_16055 [Thermomicrobiales bacterium]